MTMVFGIACWFLELWFGSDCPRKGKDQSRCGHAPGIERLAEIP